MQPSRSDEANAAAAVLDARDDREVPGAHPNASSSLPHYGSIAQHLGLSDGGRSLRNVDMAACHANDFLSVSSSSNSNPVSPFAQGFTMATSGVDLQSMSEPIRSAIQESPFQVHECLGIRWPSSPKQHGVSKEVRPCFGLVLDQNQPIQVGTLVKIVDLKSATNLNGKVGEVLCFEDKKGRFQVRIFLLKAQLMGGNACSISSSSSRDYIKLIKVGNLKVLASTSCGPPLLLSNFI